MKLSKYFALGLLVISLTPVWGQIIFVNGPDNENFPAPATNFTKFNLDFPGGTPGQLATALEKVMGKSLNIVILDNDANVPLPAIKLNNVRLPELFQTLKAISAKTEYVPMLNNQGFTSLRSFSTGCEFNTQDRNASDNAVWFFHVLKAPLSPTQEKTCRFYQLAPFLDAGLTVDDITTAIQTAWKMMGTNLLPEISFHKETKLLIAVGEPDKLDIIDNVLKALEPPKARPAVDPVTGLPLPKSEPNAGR